MAKKKTTRRRTQKALKPILIEEPRLLFDHEQATEDPRDGLTLFGPLEAGKPYGIRYGVIGTEQGIEYFAEWVARAQLPVGDPDEVARPSYPGFEAAFGIPWRPTPVFQLAIDAGELHKRINYADRHHRVYKAVELFEDAILRTHRSEDSSVDMWFVVIPDEVYRNCRPKSSIDADTRVQSTAGLSRTDVKHASKGQAHLFADDLANELARAYDFEVNFHNQLKARLLGRQIVTQIVRESTIAHRRVLGGNGEPLRDLSKVEADIAWHLATAAFYKAGGRPWKISGMRDGVCYLGLVFKHVDLSSDPHMACCAAQMFLNSGDGVVFKGHNGPWYTGRRGEYHINESAAADLVSQAIAAYRAKDPAGRKPQELFIHAKTKFNEAEWRGFTEAAGSDINVVAVQIREEYDLKLYRPGEHPVLRGTAVPIDDNLGYLWTRGLVPRLRTYIGRETPNPLSVKICRGTAAMVTVLSDVLGLTKLNYNACRYGDGEPVTLKFADAVGEILTAGPLFDGDVPPLPFKHYV